MFKKSIRKISYSAAAISVMIMLSGCSGSAPPSGDPIQSQASSKPAADTSADSSISPSGDASSEPEKEAEPVKGSRDNSIKCLVPLQDETSLLSCDVASIDYSHASDGYISVKYFGSVPIIKLRITGPDEVVYTYDLKTNDYEVFPLTGGNGDYTVAVYENIEGTQYAVAMSEIVPVQIEDELTAYLYPNQYVNFTENSECVKLASELVYSANSDLEAVSAVYDYIINNITYDTAKAESKPTNYVPDVDEILSIKTGICLDYASLMCSMLRSQGIPTRLEIGYAADAYHAWISVHIDDIGWVNGIIEFDGEKWELMDPTFGASTNDATLKKFIGDGTNYTLQKIY
ncbi:MAG: transglutaminase domain-containing protein [Lachnospiraceae bacterium]|nr:transglutaminase domain-containing protein [Lachnospiraceae bacterium]